MVAGLLAVVLIAQAGSAQIPRVPPFTTNPRPSSVLAGQVVDDTGRPVAAAVLRLVGERVVRTLIADERGRFSYDKVAPGEYVLVAGKQGYLDGAYGKRRHGGAPLPFALAATQSIDNMRIELFRAGVITGAVFDEGGEAVPGARVIASRREFHDGEWQYDEAGSDTTDDQGRYRIYGLEPGDYIVSTPTIQARLPSGVRLSTAHSDTLDDGFAYATQFYPVTSHFLLALPITLASGEVRYAVNFHWAPVPARSVSGRLAGPPADIQHQLVRLVPIDMKAGGFGSEIALTVTDEEGAFVFDRVPSGDYRLEAGPGFVLSEPNLTDVARPPAVSWGRMDVRVMDEDVRDLDVRLLQSVSIRGIIEMKRFLGEAAAGGRLGVSVIPAAPGLSPPTDAIVKGEAFEAFNLVPGPYYIRVTALPRGSWLESIREGTVSRLDLPVDASNGDVEDVTITLTDLPAEITGSVRDSGLVAAAGVALIVMPAERAVWTPHRTRLTRVSTSGTFTITGLPPGDYLIVPVDDAATEGWQDSRRLSELRTLATRVTLRPGEVVTLHLRVK